MYITSLSLAKAVSLPVQRLRFNYTCQVLIGGTYEPHRSKAERFYYTSLSLTGAGHVHSIFLSGEAMGLTTLKFYCTCRVLTEEAHQGHSSEVERFYCTCRVLTGGAHQAHSSEVERFYYTSRSSLEEPIRLIALSLRGSTVPAESSLEKPIRFIAVRLKGSTVPAESSLEEPIRLTALRLRGSTIPQESSLEETIRLTALRLRGSNVPAESSLEEPVSLMARRFLRSGSSLIQFFSASVEILVLVKRMAYVSLSCSNAARIIFLSSTSFGLA